MDLGKVLDQTQEIMKKERVVHLNDKLRIEGKGGQVICTSGVFSSGKYEQIINEVRNFNNFNEDNDPYGEHDFGKVTVDGEDYFFKIDYYDPTVTCIFPSPDKSDANVTRRVMTIMKSEEY